MTTDDRRSLTVSEVMTPEKANFAGNVHGGIIMKICDQVAYACASRYASSYVVTLSVDKMLFNQPIHVGELVTFKACVNFVGKTSMEVGIHVATENLITQEHRHTNSCYFTMVAVDENLKPKRIPPLELNTPLEKRRFEEAKLRKAMSLKIQEEHKRMKEELKKTYSPENHHD